MVKADFQFNSLPAKAGIRSSGVIAQRHSREGGNPLRMSQSTMIYNPLFIFLYISYFLPLCYIMRKEERFKQVGVSVSG